MFRFLGLRLSDSLSCPVPGRVPGSCSVPALFQAEFLASKAFLQRSWQRPWLLRRFRSWGLDSVPHFPALFQAEFLAHAAFLPCSRHNSVCSGSNSMCPGSNSACPECFSMSGEQFYVS